MAQVCAICAGHYRLAGWFFRDGTQQRLRTLSDMTQSRPQWRLYVQAITFNTQLPSNLSNGKYTDIPVLMHQLDQLPPPMHNCLPYLLESPMNKTVAAKTTVRQFLFNHTINSAEESYRSMRPADAKQ
ncbi:hypothetical protein T265_10540 [Opisthorchis viverrini]|uniref:Uncharacterized protein n=1 Tax=Opisthorchis viverrini TaxID=6198 RepID=A0A074Z237_OPIVI|nr:hypothetical protein T265_10540 [Opisthorchis viverrini]KER21048.1 hypothetical protein T265_10540 [Opisthorchis viverrini]